MLRVLLGSHLRVQEPGTAAKVARPISTVSFRVLDVIDATSGLNKSKTAAIPTGTSRRAQAHAPSTPWPGSAEKHAWMRKNPVRR